MYVGRDSWICTTQFIHMCDVTQSCAWRDSVMYDVTWLSHVRDVTQSCTWRVTSICAWHVWYMCVTWLMCMCVRWKLHVCATTHSYVWHDTFICVTWLTHMCDMTHSFVWRDPSICLTHPMQMREHHSFKCESTHQIDSRYTCHIYTLTCTFGSSQIHSRYTECICQSINLTCVCESISTLTYTCEIYTSVYVRVYISWDLYICICQSIYLLCIALTLTGHARYLPNMYVRDILSHISHIEIYSHIDIYLRDIHRYICSRYNRHISHMCHKIFIHCLLGINLCQIYI